MTKNVTIRDIAAEAGVSIALVSFVMNNRIEADGKKKYRVSEETRQRILEVAKRLNYQPNSAARSLRKGRSQVIGAVVSDISNIFYGEIAKILEEIAFSKGYTVLIGSTDESPEKMDTIVHSFIDKGVDGFLIVPCEHSQKTMNHIIKSQIPFVVMDRRDMNLPAPKIVLNNIKAMSHAVDLLISKGIRKIEMISYTMRVSSISEREEGFLRTMGKAGLEVSENAIHRAPFEKIGEYVESILPDILERKVEGLVFATNSLTIATIKALYGMGINVQEDIMLVGFDNSDVYDLFRPQIPHIQQPIEEICHKSMEMLFEIIEEKRPQENEDIELEGIVIL
ncbi:MAG: LacI family DNA-binding transcriptional regulator [Candidatus Cryptobacteroides sp.]